MKSLLVSLICEFLKLKRSGIFWITIVLFIFIPTMFGLMMFIAQHPDISAKLGLVGTKARLFGENDWKGYIGLLSQAIATIGLIGFGFVTAWIFGSEFTNRTLKDILALPVSRTAIVIAKYIVATIWGALLVIIFFGVAIAAGHMLGIPGWIPYSIFPLMNKFLITGFLTLLLSPPVGFMASYGRGIIAPLGFVILTLILAQFMGLAGIGAYFPWAIPGIFSVGENTVGLQLVPSSFGILIVTSITGVMATIAYWNKADHH